MKKNYMAPAFKCCEIMHETALLSGSLDGVDVSNEDAELDDGDNYVKSIWDSYDMWK